MDSVKEIENRMEFYSKNLVNIIEKCRDRQNEPNRKKRKTM